MKKRVLIGVLLALLATGGWWWHKERQNHARGDLTLHGNVDIREVTLGFRVGGRLVGVAKDEGDSVEPGEVLANLEEGPYRRELEAANAQVQSSQARLDLVEAGYRPQEIAQARATVAEREVTLANAEKSYRRQEELFETSAVSRQERDDADARFREADARLKLAREQLNVFEAGFRAEEIAQAKAEFSHAQANAASARIRLEDTVLKAPSSGVIIVRAQEPGAILQPGAPVLTLSLASPVWVRAYVREPDLGRLHPGMKVAVFTDMDPTKPFMGQIGFISPRAEFTPKNVETEELRTSLVYRLRIVIDSPTQALRQGMPVTVHVPRS